MRVVIFTLNSYVKKNRKFEMVAGADPQECEDGHSRG